MDENYRTDCPFCGKKSGKLLWNAGLRDKRNFVCTECGEKWIVLPPDYSKRR